MNKPKSGEPVRHAPRPTGREQVSEAGRVLTQAPPKRKPTGAVIYKIEKGADVWPRRK
jgi:hypothetical protein